MIRIRRLPPAFLKRRRYEVEYTPSGAVQPQWTKITPTPVTLIDKYIGVGDAWSVVRAADAVAGDGIGDWVTFPPASSGAA